MCDYSLELYRSRPAQTEEQYTLHRFPSGTMGFVAARDCETAVCVLAGARLQLEGITETVQRSFGIGPVEEVVMTRLDVTGHAHRDAVRFSNGKEVLLQSLNAGITCLLMPEIDLTKYRGAAEEATRDLVEAD
ncbi:MAG: hypothetical protein JOY64_22500 [Alphaproteobacteria bacterium]|nr:hypothetical protein [Alphaproteobacteria bacterium]MBV8410414.1 hypothetical protein [Alphaproteobacteria bacterium]